MLSKPAMGAGGSIGGQIVTDGLLLNLDAGKPASYPGSGTTWYDLSGNGNNFTLTSTGYSSANKGSLTFDGTSSYTKGSTSFLPNQLFADSAGSWSVEAWFKFPIAPSGTRTANGSWSIVGRAGGIATAGTFILYIGSATDVTYGNYAPYKLAATIRGAVTVMSGSLNNNTWNQIVLTWNGSSGSYYLNNGTPGVLAAGTASLQSYADFNIGSNLDVSNHLYEGNISSVNIYNKALNAAEVDQNFKALRGRYGL